jgi:16S rRNA (guanine527-N7)-methyltransferase
MQEHEVINILQNQFSFSSKNISDLKILRNELLNANKKHNFISKSTEANIWHRHILDSAQLINFFNITKELSIADLGSGAGFPGIVLAIYGVKYRFHVKLYEKSPVKRDFLVKISNKLKLNISIFGNVYNDPISADIIVCRAFKKLPEIVRISRENSKKPNKLIILKGKNAEKEIKSLSLNVECDYKLMNSMTDLNSKILIINNS